MVTERRRSALRVLCVEDSPDDAELIRRALMAGPWPMEFTVVHDEPGARAVLAREVDVVLCDFHLPRFAPLQALAVLAEHEPAIPLIVVTRSIGEEAAVSVLRAGAADYVTKDRLATLPLVVTRVLRVSAQQRRQKALLQDLETANRRLRNLAVRLERARELERSHIARELHDSLGQSLTAALVHSHAGDAAADPQVGATYRQTARQVLEQAIQQVKTLSFAMRPPQLDLLGLPATLDALASQLLRPSGIEFVQTSAGQASLQRPECETVAFRVAQEALNNIARHAGAHKVLLRLRMAAGTPGCYRLTIADDGCGFDVVSSLQAGSAGFSRGLLNMTERCELAGGSLRLRSRRGRGTVVQAILPVQMSPSP